MHTGRSLRLTLPCEPSAKRGGSRPDGLIGVDPTQQVDQNRVRARAAIDDGGGQGKRVDQAWQNPWNSYRTRRPGPHQKQTHCGADCTNNRLSSWVKALWCMTTGPTMTFLTSAGFLEAALSARLHNQSQYSIKRDVVVKRKVGKRQNRKKTGYQDCWPTLPLESSRTEDERQL